MSNIQALIQILSSAKEEAYTLASAAAHVGDTEKQRALYAIADQALAAIKAASAPEEAYPVREEKCLFEMMMEEMPEQIQRETLKKAVKESEWQIERCNIIGRDICNGFNG